MKHNDKYHKENKTLYNNLWLNNIGKMLYLQRIYKLHE